MDTTAFKYYLYIAFLCVIAGCSTYLLFKLDIAATKNTLLSSNLLFILLSTFALIISIFLSSMKFYFWFSDKKIGRKKLFEIYYGAAGVHFIFGFFGSTSLRLTLLSKLFSTPIKQMAKFLFVDKGLQLFLMVGFVAYYLGFGWTNFLPYFFCCLIFFALVIDLRFNTRYQFITSSLILILSLIRYGALVAAVTPDIVNMEIAVAYSVAQMLPLPLGGFGLRELIFSHVLISNNFEQLFAIGSIVLCQGLFILFTSLGISFFGKSE